MSVTAVHYDLVQTAHEIERYADTLRAEPAVAIDVEADSLYSYPEKLCLVQVSTSRSNTIVDPLSGGDGILALAAVLANPAITKVFHGGDYDIRLLKKEHSFEVHNVADTMIAAQLAGRSQLGLAALIEEEFGIHLQKRYQRSDWSRRPLAPELLRYAALDTAYLLQLWARLRHKLGQLGRLQWAQEEFALLEQAAPALDRPPSCFDIKGATHLQPRERAVLQALVELRDETARAWNRPPFKVLSNRVLLDWAQSPPLSRSRVLSTPRAGKAILQHLAPKIVAAVHRANYLSVGDCPHRTSEPYTPLTSDQKLRLKRLKAVRTKASKRLGLPAGLLVNSKTLESLARADPKRASDLLQSSLKRWQLEVLGAGLRQALQTEPADSP